MSELAQAIEEMRNMRESYDQLAGAAEAYNTGKTELAANITAKGIPASASETLPELAEKVGAIAQTQTILEGGEVMAAQQFGDGALWNLYQVLADMKTRFMGNGDYSALIVCEYYKGYDSLQLQGADAYYTCDGDLYEYASPNHVWHDADNDKANRWVAFLYRDDGARLDITNTSISPRSMYIGGHIGTIQYFVNGRLTALVGGVEETDVVDYFLTNGHTQAWGFNCIIKGVRYFSSNDSPLNLTIPSAGTIVLECDRIALGTSGNILTTNNATYIEIKKATSIRSGSSPVFNSSSLIGVTTPDAETIILTGWGLVFNCPNMQILDMRLAKTITANRGLIYGTCAKLIDVIVGGLTSSINIDAWNPTTVLADATKKAQLIDNIKNHILARVSDRTGLSRLTFTISTNMYNAVSGENIEWQGETMTLADAFLAKNWLLAGA